MIGGKRLDNIRYCIEQCLKHDIEGDLIERGVWRRGATIYMKGILKAYNINDRKVLVADSFEGLTSPEPSCYPVDTNDKYHTIKFLSVPLDKVVRNFKA